MNSFRFIERGIRAEIARQREILAGGGRGRPGDAPLRPGLGRDHLAALQGGGARLPLLPRARSGAGRDRRADARRPPGRHVRAARRPRAQRLQRELGLSARAPSCSRSGPSWATTSRPPLAAERRAAARRRRRSPTGSPVELVATARARVEDPADTRVPSRRAGRARRAAWRPSGSASARRGRCSTGSSPRAGDPRQIVEAEGLAAIDGGDELAGIVAAALAANADAAERVRAGQRQGDRADRGPRHARDQGPRRRHRGGAPDPRAARRLSRLPRRLSIRDRARHFGLSGQRQRGARAPRCCS